MTIRRIVLNISRLRLFCEILPVVWNRVLAEDRMLFEWKDLTQLRSLVLLMLVDYLVGGVFNVCTTITSDWVQSRYATLILRPTCSMIGCLEVLQRWRYERTWELGHPWDGWFIPIVVICIAHVSIDENLWSSILLSMIVDCYHFLIGFFNIIAFLRSLLSSGLVDI